MGPNPPLIGNLLVFSVQPDLNGTRSAFVIEYFDSRD